MDLRAFFLLILVLQGCAAPPTQYGLERDGQLLPRAAAELAVAQSMLRDRDGNPLSVKVVSATLPPYPADLRRRGVEGKVAVRLEIRPDGSVTNVAIVGELLPELARVVLDAVNKWRFASLGDDDQRTTSAYIEFHFRLSP